MEGRNEVGGVVLKKGPWTAEEDEILMDYVRKNGPRDWSSIRSKGLLPRSGKSCRLRWVNKLKPNLKTGCKFTKEEERIVLDLQARFGNKWAKIATYLQGRTDNDVKNFWSTRQKRLARIQRAENAQGKESSGDDSPADLTEEQMVEYYGYSLFTNRRVRESSTCESSNFPKERDNPNHDARMILSHQQDLQGQHINYSSNDMMNDMDPTLPLDHPLLQQQQQEDQYIDANQTLVPAETQNLPEISFSELPEALLDLPLLPEVDQDMDISIADVSCFEYPFASTDMLDMTMAGLEGQRCETNGDPLTDDGIITNTLDDDFFEEFPLDILDYVGKLPPPSD